jgi:two-component system cell cycle response regulator DivK
MKRMYGRNNDLDEPGRWKGSSEVAMENNIRILIIEDDRDNLDLMSFMMRRQGYTVLEASDGRQGLAVARRELPDLILLDLAMPDVDGWTVSHELKSDPATQHIKIVVVTVRSLLEDRRRAIESGCDAYITKPMNMAQLAELVAKHVKNNAGESDSLRRDG